MKERDIIMQINKVNSANQPSFKGIVSKGFLKHMKKEVQGYVKQRDVKRIETISNLFNKMKHHIFFSAPMNNGKSFARRFSAPSWHWGTKYM